jgi:predicted RNA binding protein YcfA (HicA-like mRNA interferase family)
VPRRCRRIHHRAARMLRVSKVAQEAPKAGSSGAIGRAATMGGSIPTRGTTLVPRGGLTQDGTHVHLWRAARRNDRMPRKIRELVRDLVKAGFEERSGKGSHRNYSHPLVAKVVTISGRDGDDARRHLEKTVQEAINEVNQWRKATDT